jgi:hypothetical protein
VTGLQGGSMAHLYINVHSYKVKGGEVRAQRQP